MPLYRGSRRLILRGGSNPVPGAAATTFLARTSGLSTPERNAYITLINGLVADGNWTRFDALYIFATNTTTTANLNLVSTSFGLVQTGTVTFTADTGYTGNGSTGYLDCFYAPNVSGVNYTLNSGSIGIYIRTNQTSADASVVMGCSTGSDFSYMSPMNTGSVFSHNINDATFTGPANTTSLGSWVASRTGASTLNLYKNGATTFSSASPAATSVPGSSMFILALSSGGTPGNFCAYQVSAAFIASGLTSAQAFAVNNRINDFMRALSVNIY